MVNIHDMTLGEHFEIELAIVKLNIESGDVAAVRDIAASHAAEVLDEDPRSFTLRTIGMPADIDRLIAALENAGSLSAVARSGSVAVSRGKVTLSSYVRQHRLTG